MCDASCLDCWTGAGPERQNTDSLLINVRNVDKFSFEQANFFEILTLFSRRQILKQISRNPGKGQGISTLGTCSLEWSAVRTLGCDTHLAVAVLADMRGLELPELITTTDADDV